ncbi:thioredoxin family protein [Loigolactobacillus zhaoyuanensis]|uniref:Thioredoxin n=1 Tax=Loigolactobacillus zhaoyuanensis TaxID=2486017 RepID=A0ABW8U9P8_9LACO|nr:thioredoxin family protein [Loigolactobacillus zhaoyuanensis]
MTNIASELNENNFVPFVRSGTVLIDFWAAWCVPCQKMTPILLACEQALPQLSVGRLNVDDYPQLTKKLQVQGLPTLLLFQHGEPVARVSGFQPQDRLLAYLKQKITVV